MYNKFNYFTSLRLEVMGEGAIDGMLWRNNIFRLLGKNTMVFNDHNVILRCKCVLYNIPTYQKYEYVINSRRNQSYAIFSITITDFHLLVIYYWNIIILYVYVEPIMQIIEKQRISLWSKDFWRIFLFTSRSL